jgi:predicted RecB family nuclease
MIRASDAMAWQYCSKRAWFTLHPPEGYEIERDPFEVLLESLGQAHELEVLQAFDGAVEATSVEHTSQLMKDLKPVIYQPKFVDDSHGIVGYPDFLILKGDGYQVGDAKLALSLEGRSENYSLRHLFVFL